MNEYYSSVSKRLEIKLIINLSCDSKLNVMFVIVPQILCIGGQMDINVTEH